MSLTVRAATMAGYEAVCRLKRALDDHHVRLLPERFRVLEGTARPRELIEQFVKSEDAAMLVADEGSQVAGALNMMVRCCPNQQRTSSR